MYLFIFTEAGSYFIYCLAACSMFITMLRNIFHVTPYNCFIMIFTALWLAHLWMDHHVISMMDKLSFVCVVGDLSKLTCCFHKIFSK